MWGSGGVPAGCSAAIRARKAQEAVVRRIPRDAPAMICLFAIQCRLLVQVNGPP